MKGEYTYSVKVGSSKDIEINVHANVPSLAEFPHDTAMQRYLDTYIMGHIEGFKAGFERGCIEADDQKP